MSAAPKLEFDLPGGHVVFTTRRGGVSEGAFESLNLGIATSDDDARVRENRRRVADRIGLSPRDVVMSRQVHGAEIREWPHGWRDGGDFISPKPLEEPIPVAVNNKQEFTTQFEMSDLEKTGMLKMDYLGLTTLTIIDQCCKTIKEMHGRRIDWSEIPQDDPKTY